ncbi:suppressor of fused domain protein [Leminorella grimontii]|uniref:suppressor of fused domain protein n=1 Tax=Leminorella grimontii TaxID=82981 RepID=UPI00321FA9D0
MDLATFRKNVEEDESWAPGWDEIDLGFSQIYGEQNPDHYGTEMTSRATFGGDQYLDGYSLFASPKGYRHIVTYGMSQLYADEEALGGEFSKWGYEMTIKLPAKEARECEWALNMLSNLARYTFTSKRYFEPYQYIGGSGESIHIGEPSKITALLVVPDTEIAPRDSLYGRLEFLQLVGITEVEFQQVKETPEKVHQLIENMKQDNPDLITDMGRTKNYL